MRLKNLIKIFLILDKKERFLFFLLILFVLISNTIFFLAFYEKYTIPVPAKGGILKEGLVGQPHLINPIYALANDIDQDLVELTFNSLLKLTKNNEIVPDLAESYEIKENNRIYEITLKKNLIWQDGEPLTVDDVIYTIKIIQDPSYKSPLRIKWLGVEVKKQNDHSLRFILEKPYPLFIETLATTKIIPKHIWGNIPAENFALVEYNLQKVIGSGPYQIEKVVFGENHSIEKIKLKENPFYFGKKPYIPELEFYFFPTEKELLRAAENQLLTSFSLIEPDNYSPVIKKTSYRKKALKLPRYFALFFNKQRNELLDNKKIREALGLAINQEEILKNVLQGEGSLVSSPILPSFYNIDFKINTSFDPDQALEILKNQGFKKNKNGYLVKIIRHTQALFTRDLKKGSQGREVRLLQECLAKDPEVYPEAEITGYFGEKTKKAVIRFQEKYKSEVLKPAGLNKGTGIVGSNTRKKLNEVCGETTEEVIPLEVSLVTLNQNLLIKTAEIIKSNWEKIGVKTSVSTYDFPTLKEDIIKPRNYQILLFGEVLGKFPDPFPFWHSSQKKHPGLNLAEFENKKADKLLEKIKQTADKKERNQLLIEFARIIEEEKPAIFLFNPYYLYFISPEIKNFTEKKILLPSDRFRNIPDWYLKTKRVWVL